ncbi:Protein trichome birefringence-like 12 [Dichanthelium oligosanthes]|uniref:Protein trichome birefringence-like 12 n=1 Tax=Dichanthelium oligosanthes TaxID=888268 RepID=A0A1E5UQ40_9POAL|nr:Protein trichome birefringence-like 12 [Dichanthelium oligosanthes]
MPRLRLPLVLLLPIALTIILLLLASSPSSRLPTPQPLPCGAALSDAADGRWVPTPSPAPPRLYSPSCPFHRNAWNCLRNGRPQLAALSWAPTRCGGAVVPRIDAAGFLAAARGRRVGLVGDSLSENLVVALLCALRSADDGARKWKRRGAWRGGYFPREDVVVAYHRAVLLAKYTWQPLEKSKEHQKDRIKGTYRVDVDIPADDWVNVTKFYDVLIFNTGHWWDTYKFPKETPLVFYKGGKPIEPPLGMHDGLKVVLKSMASYVEREVPRKTLKLWRTQSPRHFYGGEWDHNGSCVSDRLLEEHELDSWFDPRFGGVNKDARMVNSAIQGALAGTDIQLLNLTYMSEFRADAHPAIWLGKKDAVAVYGQDCMHWCLPGVPDTWVDILAAQILHYLKQGKG